MVAACVSPEELWALESWRGREGDCAAVMKALGCARQPEEAARILRAFDAKGATS